MKLKGLEEIVKSILETRPITRADDFLLYGTVLSRLGIDLNMSMKDFLRQHKLLQAPSFESVSRCRRKLQMFGQLLPDTKTIEKREQEQDKFYAYGLGIEEN